MIINPYVFAAPAWTPASFGANLRAWYKSDVGITLNSGNVSQWDDQSGNSNHLIQSTATSQPLLSSSVINGYDVVSFDGSNDFMQTTNFGLSQPQTFVLLFQLNGTPPNIYGNIHDGVNGNSASIECANTATSTWYAYGGATLTNKVINTIDWHLSILTFNGVNSEWYFDSEAVTTGNGGSTNAGGLTLGRYAPGPYYSWYKTTECFILNTTVNATNVANIKGYINTRYGLSFT